MNEADREGDREVEGGRERSWPEADCGKFANQINNKT